MFDFKRLQLQKTLPRPQSLPPGIKLQVFEMFVSGTSMTKSTPLCRGTYCSTGNLHSGLFTWKRTWCFISLFFQCWC